MANDSQRDLYDSPLIQVSTLFFAYRLGNTSEDRVAGTERLTNRRRVPWASSGF
jgi:hypothetical protein